jgi:hypothetical protein
MKRTGKWGKLWNKERAKLKKEFEKRGIFSCEAQLQGCMKEFALSFHHRYRRYYYRSYPEKLGDFNQVILLCSHCHQTLEQDSELTQKVFIKLRPKNYEE